MRNASFYLLVGFLCLVAFGLFGAGEAEVDEEEVVTLKIAVEPTYMERVRPLLPQFLDEHPNIRIEEQPITLTDWPQYLAQIRTLIAGGNPPDVVRIASEGLEYMVDGNMAQPLDEYMERFPEYANEDDFHPNLLAAYESGGNIYGLPFNWNTVVTHMNLDMLEDVGLPFPESEDWDKQTFLEYAQALTREVDGQQIYGLYLPDDWFLVSAWLYNFDAAFLTDDLSESAVDSQEAHEAFEFMYDLVHEYGVAPRPAPGLDFMDHFVAGQVAMGFAGRWPLPLWIENEMNFDIQHVPSFAGKIESIYGIGAWPVLTMSENHEEAFKLAAFLASEDAVRELVGPSAIPARKDLLGDEDMVGPPPDNWQLWSKVADEGRAVQAPTGYPELSSIFDRHFSEMMTGDISVEQALSNMHEEFNEALD